MCAARCVSSEDHALVSAVMKAMGEDLGISPTSLGVFVLCEKMAYSFSAPAWAVAARIYSRPHLVAFSCLVWGLVTIATGFTDSFDGVVALRVLNGLAVASLVPIAGSVSADLFPASSRGRAFGMLGAVGAMGSAAGHVFSTSISHWEGSCFGWRVSGWRVAFFVIGSLSVLLFVVIRGCQVRDVPFGLADEEEAILEGGGQSSAAVEREEVGGEENDSDSESDDGNVGISDERELLLPTTSRTTTPTTSTRITTNREEGSFKEAISEIVSSRTFFVIVLQGFFGAVPASAFAFLTFWLQLTGYSDFQSSVLHSVYNAGRFAGVLCGGWAGDWAAVQLPDHGRIFVAQFSNVLRIPAVTFLFYLLPADTSLWHWHAASLAIVGFLSPWVAVGANRPILSEVVSPEARGQIFSVQKCVEGLSAALFGAPMVGYLSEHVFGFVSVPVSSVDAANLAYDSSDASDDDGTGVVDADDVSASIPANAVSVAGLFGGDDAGGSGSLAQKAANAKAMGSSICAITVVCWGMCLLLYTVLHFTYPLERGGGIRQRQARKREDAATRTTMLQPLLHANDEDLTVQNSVNKRKL